MTPFATFAEVIGTGALLVALMTFVMLRLDKRRDRWREAQEEMDQKFTALRHNHDVLVQRFSPMEQDIKVLKTQVEIFWKGVAYSSSQALHSPHTPELDRLIEKFQQETITAEELAEFKNRLRILVNDPAESVGKKKAARETLLAIHVQYDLLQTMGGLTTTYYEIRNIFGDVSAVLPTETTQSSPDPRFEEPKKKGAP